MELEKLKANYWQVIETGFVCVPNLIIFDNRLSSAALKLYQIILFHAFGKKVSFPGENLLAQEMKCTTRQIKRYKKELKKIGWLTWTHKNKHCFYSTTIPRQCKLSKEPKIVKEKNVREFGMSVIADILRSRKSKLTVTPS